MGDLLLSIAKFISENSDLRKKRNYDIYNEWFSKHEYRIEDIREVKLILDYIDDIKKIDPILLSDSLEKE